MNQRKSGRQSATTAQQTRQRILNIALDMFSEQGYNRVSLRAISEQAMVSHSLLRHHFGSKALLWQQVNQQARLAFYAYMRQFVRDTDSSKSANLRLFLVLLRMQACLLCDAKPLRLLADLVQQERSVFDELFIQEEVVSEFEQLFNVCKQNGYLKGFEYNDVKWMMISWSYSASELRPFLDFSTKTCTRNALEQHWYLFALLLAPQLGLDESAIPNIVSLESLLLSPSQA